MTPYEIVLRELKAWPGLDDEHRAEHIVMYLEMSYRLHPREFYSFDPVEITPEREALIDEALQADGAS
jgi:hypothetical protein